MYQSVLPNSPHLPEERQKLWTYFKLWPNVAFDIYPDQVDFMQMIPVSPTETLIREIAYAHPDSRREMRAARYLNWRINRRVSVEDKASSNGCRPAWDREASRRGPWAAMRCLCAASRAACAN